MIPAEKPDDDLTRKARALIDAAKQGNTQAARVVFDAVWFDYNEELADALEVATEADFKAAWRATMDNAIKGDLEAARLILQAMFDGSTDN